MSAPLEVQMSQPRLHHALAWLGQAWDGETLRNPLEVAQFYTSGGQLRPVASANPWFTHIRRYPQPRTEP